MTVWLLSFLLWSHSLAAVELSLPAARDQTSAATDASLRIRIQNTDLGSVQVSTDAGKTWRLIGRVGEPALEVLADERASAPGVVQTAPDCSIIAVGPRRTFRITASTAGPPPRDVLTVSPASAIAVLDLLFRTSRAAIWLESSGRTLPLYEGYVPSDGDVLVLGLAPAGPDALMAGRSIDDAVRAYDLAARKRYEAGGKKPMTGYLTVVARPPLRSDAGPVLFLLDGSPVAIINRPPHQVRWDTRDWQNGEHLIEVRSLDAMGHMLSRSKSLVYVENRGRGD